MHRLWRGAGVIALFLAGAALAGFVGIGLDPARKLQAIHRLRRRLARWSLALLGVRLHVSGSLPGSGPLLVTANHLGYIDVPILAALLPVRFVAKTEVGSWPVIGPAVRLWGTLFVRRESVTSASAFVDTLVQYLRAGEMIAVFPEGTSSDGTAVLPFRTGPFAAVERFPEARVLPVRLTIARVDGAPPSAEDRRRVAWFGRTPFLPHLFTLTSLKLIDIQVRIGSPLVPQNESRKELAARVEWTVTIMGAPSQSVRQGRTYRLGFGDRPVSS